jgi:energy-coupling factor transporter ATP-binding protein EcfA2
MIQRLEISNFMSFKRLTLDLSPGVNVIIGENGTGKTHLLKAAWALAHAANARAKSPNQSTEDFEKILASNLIRLFLPLDDRLGKMHHHGATDHAIIAAQFTNTHRFSAKFFNNSRSVNVKHSPPPPHLPGEPVFIPTKEVLSFMKGFASLYNKYELSFDSTYDHLCLLLDLPEIRPESLHPKSKWAIEELERICCGRFHFYGGGKVTFKTENSEYSANAVAEGFRKAGILARLLQTGAIQPGISGPLLWDEPESNLNPRLMKDLVQILLELARQGQQIILSTHDYVLLKCFDLLMDQASGDHVLFHSLYRGDGRIICSDSTPNYLQIAPNAISATFADLTREHVTRRMGGLGK